MKLLEESNFKGVKTVRTYSRSYSTFMHCLFYFKMVTWAVI